MGFGDRIRRAFPEPKDVSFPGFTDLDETAVAGGSLKCL
jgi:hypothetical protein